jgi:hypothetical protein
MPGEKKSRPELFQLFLDRASELVPGLADRRVQFDQAAGNRKEAVAAWQRAFGLDGCEWIAYCAEVSLEIWQRMAPDASAGERRLVYIQPSPAEGEVPIYRYVINREYFRTGDPEHFRASLHQALDKDLDRFIGQAHPQYKPVPPPTADMTAGVDCLVLRLCLRMSAESILKHLFPGQRKDWNALQRSARRVAAIIGITTPSRGRHPRRQKLL